MPNPIKYSTGSETLALKKGNFYIGTGDVGKGPTSETGYYNGITPPSGGYTVYLNKASGGPSIYTCANDTELISLTNSIAGTSYTTANECFTYFTGQSDKMVLNRDYEGIVTDGLVLNLDAGFTPSYSRSGTTWYDVGGSNNGTLTNGPTFDSANGGSIVFYGTNDYVDCGSNASLDLGSFTQEVWFKPVIGRRNPILGDSNSDSSDSRHSMWLELYNNNKFILIFGDGSKFGDVFSLTTVSSNNIICVSCVRNNTNKTVQFYINGTGESVQPWANQSTIGTPVTLGIYSLWIGGSNGYGNMKDNIYNVRIYNRTLSAAEILQNYNAQKGRFGL